MSCQYIVIPLYDHTAPAEVAEILDELRAFGFSHDPYLARAAELPEHADVDESADADEGVL